MLLILLFYIQILGKFVLIKRCMIDQRDKIRKKLVLRRPIMADKVYCKHCGSSYPSISSLTSGSCSKNPTKRHQPYEGSEKPKYYCEHCGSSYSSISSLTSGTCSKSPTKYHQPYEGDEKSKYICKHCGNSYSSISSLTSNSCSKSPTKYHQPAK
jgi:DNA-directed RNA polymerase subunit RPC12/RpoP